MYNRTLYIGRNTLRHEDEDSYDSDLWESREAWGRDVPGAYPHVFVDYEGRPVEARELLLNQSLSPKGSSSVLVSYQKEVRDRNSHNQVERWRESFTPEMLDGRDIDWADADGLAVMDDITSGAPFVILSVDNPELGVPLTVEDMREKLVEVFEQNGLDTTQIREASDATIRNMYQTVSGS